jgi:hypothetical protein
VLSTGNISDSPVLFDYAWVVMSAFSASGSRISPALDITPANTIGASSVTWAGDTPAGTTLAVDSSTDGSTFTPVVTSGNPVAGLVGQGAALWDTFDSDTSASYTFTAGSWLWDTANSRLMTQGTTGTDLTRTGLTLTDAEVIVITNQLHDLSIILRSTASNDRYSIVMSDNSGAWGPLIDLHRITPGGGDVLLAHASLSFVRGTYHTLRVVLSGSIFFVSFDGIQLYAYTDPSPITHAGSIGLNRGTGTSYVNNLLIRPLGASATGKNMYTKVRMTSTDPLVTPRLTDLVASVRSPDIATGNVLPQTQYSYKNSIAACLDDGAKQSDLSWRFDELYKLKMTDRLGQIAPFVIATANGNIDGPSAPKVTRGSPAYRNRQYITGAVDLQVIAESKMGDGITQSWPLKYPVDALLEVSVNGQPQSFGIQGTDTGRMFYYQQGQNTLSLDSSATSPAGAFDVTYVGRVPYRAMAEDIAQQAILAALDGSTGIVEATEDVPGLSSTAADARAQARLDQNARLAIDWTFTTRQSGLDPGQLLPVVVPEYGLNDFQFLITGISTSVKQDKDGNLLYWHNVSTTTGPSTGNWARRLQVALLKKG